MARYILTLDQGTTSSRAIVFDQAGQQVSSAQQEFGQHYPRPGWVEHDPAAIWDTQLNTARAALERAQIGPEAIAAIGITNQRETTVLWDRQTGEPIHNAIVWQCRRTSSLCDQLKREGFDQIIRERTGLVTDAYFSGTKIAWLLDHVPGARARAERGELAFGTIDSFLVWKLTGGRLHVTDVGNASRTLLYNIFTGDWDDVILARLNIPRSLLPEVKPSSYVYGETDAACFGRSLPIAGIAGDQQAATFGQNCLEVGMAKNTYGTGCFLLMNTGAEPIRSNHQLLTTIGWQLGDAPVQYALEGSIFIAGAVVQWLRDTLGIIENAAETEHLATSIDSAEGVYFVPAFVGLGTPYWDPYARGTIVGLTRGSGRAHLVRAALESVAYQTRDLVEAMHRASGIALRTLRVDGGMVGNNFLLQFQADVLGTPVERTRINETTALGAGYLAGLAVGFWRSTDEIATHRQIDRVFEPQMSESERDTLYAGWRRAVERSRGWLAEA